MLEVGLGGTGGCIAHANKVSLKPSLARVGILCQGQRESTCVDMEAREGRGRGKDCDVFECFVSG